LLPEFSALENVMMPALIAGHGKRASEKQARELLEFVGLSHRLNHRPQEMSGGEQQRVAIARSVILNPRLLLADEPTGNLDSQNSRNVIDLLLRLNREKQVTLLLVTHDREIANRMQRTLLMRDGVFVDRNTTSP
jgi:lipoprotein-releasing system ATP-binding protein